MLPEGAKPILTTGEEPAPLSGGPARPRGSGGNGGRRGWGRWIAAVFAFSAVVGFGSLLAYTYLETRDGATDPNSLPIVRADTRPMKTRPDQPGGIDVPFQDKEIYNRVGQQSSGGATTQAAQGGQVERLLPGPEAVMPRPVPEPPPAPRVVVPDAPQVEPTADAVPVTAPPRASIQPGGANAPAPVPPPTALQVPTAPRPQQAAPAAPTPAAPAARPATPAPAPQIAAAPAAGGIRIQLASVRSQADAQREWERLRRQHGDVLGNLTASFPTVDLGDRGMFWRIQAGGFANADAAQAACAALRARGAGCNVVR
jgi:cell division septation protein DedD